MAWTYIASATGVGDASGTSLDCSGSLNVAVGDLVVCAYKYEGATTAVTVGGSDAENMMTLSGLPGSPPYNLRAEGGYVIIDNANATQTFRLTPTDARAYRALAVMQFRPDSGDTVSLDGSITQNAGDASNPTGSNFNTAGDDVVIVGCLGMNGSSWSPTIKAVACTGSADATNGDGSEAVIWYKIFTEAQTDSNIGCSSDANRYILTAMPFKSVAAAGGSIVPLVMAMSNQFAGGGG